VFTRKPLVSTALALFLVMALSLVPLTIGALAAWDHLLVSAGPTGLGANSHSFDPSLSADGTKLSYSSYASDLMSASTGEYQNVFFYDAVNDQTLLVSAGAGGTAADGNSWQSAISGDGTKVVFASGAHNFDGVTVTGDQYQLFIWDLVSGEIKLITKGSSGTGGNDLSIEPSVSYDGSKVAFTSQATDLVGAVTDGYALNVFLWDADTDSTILVSKGAAGRGGDSWSEQPSISYDGSKVAFASGARNLNDAVITGDYHNVFVWNGFDDSIKLVSETAAGAGGNGPSNEPSISGNGEFIAFVSAATDLAGTSVTPGDNMNAFLWFFQAGIIDQIDVGPSLSGDPNNYSAPSVNEDGTQVAIVEGPRYAPTMLPLGETLVETNGELNVYHWNRTTGVSSLVSCNDAGSWGNRESAEPSISGDGTRVAHSSYASDLSGAPTDNGFCNVFLADEIPPAMVTVTFDAQNGTAPVSTSVAVGSPVAEPGAPTKAGYTFAGWWTAPSGGVQWNFGDPVLSDMTLYAHWVPNGTPEPPVPPVPPTGDALTLTSLAITGLAGCALVLSPMIKKRFEG